MKSLTYIVVFFFSFLVQSQSINQLTPIKNTEIFELKKSNLKTTFISLFENGKIFTNKTTDSLIKHKLYSWYRKTPYTNKTKDSIFFIYSKLSKEERDKKIEQSKAAYKVKSKKDKKLRNKLDGTIVNDLQFTDINGKSYTSNSLKGKIVVLNFWFIQCKPCVAEFPDLNKLKAEFKNKPVEFFAVTFNDSKSLTKFLRSKKLDFVVVPNSKNIIDKFKIPYYPYNIIIDQEGKVEYINDVMSLNILNRVKRKIKSLL